VGSDRGVNGFHSFGPRGITNAARKPKEGCLSGFGIVKCQAHRSQNCEASSFVLGEGENLEKQPVATKRGVLVVEAVGSKCRLDASVLVLGDKLQGKSHEGGLARSNLRTADAGGGELRKRGLGFGWS